MLAVIGDQIKQRESVVSSDEVDAGERIAGVVGIEVRAAGEAVGKLPQRFVLAAPEISQAVAVFAIPLGPAGGEVADLVATFAKVPGFSDELDLADDRILLHDVEEGG